MLAPTSWRWLVRRRGGIRARSSTSYTSQCRHFHPYPVGPHLSILDAQLIRRPNSLPSVTGDADWRAERNAFVWTIDTIDAENPTGSLEFKCEGDADAFFPVNVGFVAAGSLADVDVSRTPSSGIPLVWHTWKDDADLRYRWPRLHYWKEAERRASRRKRS